MSELSFNQYVRTPFAVEATVITQDNIEEVAKLVGTVRVKDNEKYIALDRRIVPNISRAYVGWYITRLGDNLRCYSPKVFEEQFKAIDESKLVVFDFNTPDADGFKPASDDTWQSVKEEINPNAEGVVWDQ